MKEFLAWAGDAETDEGQNLLGPARVTSYDHAVEVAQRYLWDVEMGHPTYNNLEVIVVPIIYGRIRWDAAEPVEI